MVAAWRLFKAAILAACFFAGPAKASPRDDLAVFHLDMGNGADAIASKDFVAARGAYQHALRSVPQHPTAIYRLALADASLNKSDEALALLNRVAAMGLQVPESFDASFSLLKTRPAFSRVKSEIARNTAPLCSCGSVFDGPAQPFIAEGLAFDARNRRLLVSSVYQRKIVAVASGRVRDFTTLLPAGLSPFSLTLDDARNLVWASAASLMQSHGATTAQRGRSALLAFRLGDGALARNFAGPAGADFGDTTLAPDGTVYVTDSRSGGVYRLKSGAEKLEPFTKALSSPQGIAISPDNRTALVADYGLGLTRLDLSTGKLSPIAVPDTATTLGMDGLIQLFDGSFLGTQNGIAPARVVRFHLSPDWSRVLQFTVVARNAPPIADPSLLTASGGDVYVTGVSQWASFDDTKPEPVRPVPGFRIVRLALRR